MLYFALVVAAILLLVVNLIAWRGDHPVSGRLIITSAFSLGLISTVNCILMLPPVLWQALLICVVAWIWGRRRGKAWHFLALSCAATAVAFALPGFFAYRQTKHMQEAFPYISMENRFPPTKKQRPPAALPSHAEHRLTEMETLIEDRERGSTTHSLPSVFRNRSLRQIHEETVQLFVNQPGFGVTRMIVFSEQALKRGPHDEPAIPQPGTRVASPWLPEQLQKERPGLLFSEAAGNLLSLHCKSVVDFVNVAGFGYIKDRRHVAGFQEHQVSEAPVPERPWTLQMLDLIGLVFHEKPTAYVSEHLPRMQELKSAPTRELDEFESIGLLALQRGEDLFVRERREERRMLGAIRAARRCLVCHEAERGDLLGAFSYRMTSGGSHAAMNQAERASSR